MYPESQTNQRKLIRFYKQEEMLSVPEDYFEDIKRGLSSELAKGYVETKVCLGHHLQIAHEIEDLRRIIVNQNSRFLQLENANIAQRAQLNDQPKIVVLKEVSKEEGKQLVEGYFKEHGCADIEELMLNLGISVQTIVEIIDELWKEGKLVSKGEMKT